jgi:Asp/Glu/hydantoin racemase
MSDALRRIAMINSDGKTAPVLPDPPGVATTLHDLRFRVLARTPYEHLFTELGTLDVAEQALRDGCDVVYVDTFGDYAVERIRALTTVPVLGAGEESIRQAAAAHPAFSIVTVWPESMRFLYDLRLTATPGGRHCRGVHHLSEDDELERIGRSDGVKARMGRHDGDIVEDLAALCRRALDEDGSEAVLLGCTCMSPVADAVEDRLGTPVLDPSAIGLAAAHAAALAAVPTQTESIAVRHTGLAGVVVEAYLTAQQAESVWIDDCEVCVINQTVS